MAGRTIRPAVGATSSDESDRPRRSGERRSGSRRGRRSSDAVGRTSGPPIAVPIRLFEPDFQRQTIHSPSSDLTSTRPASVDRSAIRTARSGTSQWRPGFEPNQSSHQLDGRDSGDRERYAPSTEPCHQTDLTATQFGSSIKRDGSIVGDALTGGAATASSVCVAVPARKAGHESTGES